MINFFVNIGDFWTITILLALIGLSSFIAYRLILFSHDFENHLKFIWFILGLILIGFTFYLIFIMALMYIFSGDNMMT